MNTRYNLHEERGKKPLKRAGGAKRSLDLIESSIILTKNLEKPAYFNDAIIDSCSLNYQMQSYYFNKLMEHLSLST
jgi:hypothetical protein